MYFAQQMTAIKHIYYTTLDTKIDRRKWGDIDWNVKYESLHVCCLINRMHHAAKASLLHVGLVFILYFVPFSNV